MRKEEVVKQKRKKQNMNGKQNHQLKQPIIKKWEERNIDDDK